MLLFACMKELHRESNNCVGVALLTDEEYLREQAPLV